MDINDDGRMANLIHVKCETVIRSFRWKKDTKAYAFTGVSWRLDEIKIRELDLKQWKLGTKLSRVQLNSRLVPQYVFTGGQWFVSGL